MQGTFIGVLMSSTLPARLGEPSRALIVARRLGRARETLPVVLGTMVSQLLINLLVLALLGVAMFSSVDPLDGHHGALIAAALAPVAALAAVLVAPALVPSAAVSSSARLEALRAGLRSSLARVRDGLRIFARPRRAALAIAIQAGAWALQWLSCWLLLMALGLDARAGVAGAAAVLFAVNATAVVPATPANVGVFQAACVAVLVGAYHVSTPEALAYGIVLQVVEVATARDHGPARARQRGPLLARGAPAHAARRAREARAAARRGLAPRRARRARERCGTGAEPPRRCRHRRARGVSSSDGRRLGLHAALSRRLALHGLEQRRGGAPRAPPRGARRAATRRAACRSRSRSRCRCPTAARRCARRRASRRSRGAAKLALIAAAQGAERARRRAPSGGCAEVRRRVTA